MTSDNRTVRIFLSSTFRDFGQERDLLVRRVFPSLRARLKGRFVELVDVDLRWGITVEQAERGEVLPICLAEIDRARPFFIGMLGERYGWIPSKDAYAPYLLNRQPWLEEHCGDRSVTELEILHGVLNNPKMAGRAFFYFRSGEYARKMGDDYVAASKEEAERQATLKDRIRQSGFPVLENYPTPEAFADRLEADLWSILDAAFPADQIPDAFEREERRHEAYAAPRRRLYIGGEKYIKALDAALLQGAQRVLIEGASGGGKTALLANWLEHYRETHPLDLVHEHYMSASDDAADPIALVRRFLEFIKRTTGSENEIPGDPKKILESLPLWLAIASAYASKRGIHWIIVLDAFNGLGNLRDLRWFPSFLPEHVHLIVSCLPGEILEALTTKGRWDRLKIEPLSPAEKRDLLVTYLACYNKTLPSDLAAKALLHPLSSNPLFIRTLAEELRVFGIHEALAERLTHYLASETIENLFERVLERVEGDCGGRAVRMAMEAIWASRAGLTEEEILAIVDLVPATWAPIRYALDDAIFETGGRLIFSYNYLYVAVRTRYLATESDQTRLHTRLAQWFETHPVDARAAEEVPYQWREAKEWERLKVTLTRRSMFEALTTHRSNEELLSYWLDLEREAKADIELDYAEAWEKWSLDPKAKETGELATILLSFLSFAGKYTAFTEHLGQLSLEIDEKILGADHPDTAKSLNDLASLFIERNKYEAAEPLFRRALAIREKQLGGEHPATAASFNNLAILLCGKTDYEGAEQLYRRALAIQEKSLGVAHPATAASLNNLATVLHDQWDYDGAEQLYRRALAIQEKSLGPTHPDTVGCVNNLARLLRDKYDYDAAEQLFFRALTIRGKVLGTEHPDTAESLNDLGGVLKAKEDYDGAERLYRRALAVQERSLGVAHPAVADKLNNLANLLSDQGDDEAAEPIYRRALAIQEKSLGVEHPATATSLHNLASVLATKGDYDAAEALFCRALVIREKRLGAEHPATAASLHNMATMLSDKHDYEASERLFRRALAIREKRLGTHDPRTAQTRQNLTELLAEKGDCEAAESLDLRMPPMCETAPAE